MLILEDVAVKSAIPALQWCSLVWKWLQTRELRKKCGTARKWGITGVFTEWTQV